MKICDLTQFYSPVSGGVKRYIHEKRRYIERYTQDEHYLIVPGDATRHSVEGRLHTFTVQSPRLDRTSRYRLLLNTGHVRDLLDEFRPDVIEAGDPYHLAWCALRAGRELHIPVFGFYHSHFPDAYLRTVAKFCGPMLRDYVMSAAQNYIVRLYTQFHRTLVAAGHLRNLLVDWGVGNAVVTKLGVDTEAFHPGPPDLDLRRELGLPEETVVLLYVGRLSGEKNIVTLLRAFELLHARAPGKFHLMMIGDGPLRRLLPAVRARTHALSWRTYFNDSAALARYYRMADLFVHPGVCETFGLVPLESQACGCPVAGIRGTYMDANIFAGLEDWNRGNTPENLAGTIERMTSRGRPALRAMGAAASVEVTEHFAWPRVFAHLWSHYQAACEEQRRARAYGALLV